MRILFMGTPEFAVPSLNALVAAGHDIVGVFTQPDKPKNRGMKLLPTPVKECALSHNIPVFQPVKLRDGTALAQIEALAPELIVVAAYGRILPDDILDYPKMGCINVHSSLLPKYRGAAPINWAVLNGDTVTGVTIMHMATELDAGDMIDTVTTEIDPNETVEVLYKRLAQLGATQLVESVSAIENGTAKRVVQDGSKMTLAPMLDKSLSPMDWHKSARALHNQVRGLLPWPCAETMLDGVRCKVFSTKVLSETSEKTPGTIVQADKNGLCIACGDGTVLKLEELGPEGKKRMPATAFLQGHPIHI
ncbi:MAG: methionyl-tRNA formyltransferase [Oscillospiraceae bacterium]